LIELFKNKSGLVFETRCQYKK